MTAPPVNAPAMDKIELIQRSLRAFFFGVPGIVPFLGIPFALVAILQHSRIRRRRGPLWNPAGRYLLWGVICAHIGVALTVILSALGIAVLLLKLFY